MSDTPASELLGLDQLPRIGPAIVTLGVFDGAHLGHRAALETTARAARREGVAAVALAFDPHPIEVLRPGAKAPRLAPVDENLARLRRAGLADAILAIRFDDALSRLPALEFLDSLGPAIDVRGVAMAPGSAFGHGRDGTPERLRMAGRRVILVRPAVVDEEPVSSTRIRGAVTAGAVELAARLGAPAYLRGLVVPGDRRGRELGFPTANLAFAYTPVLPSLGIYLGRASVPERGVGPEHPALISIGVRPTFHEGGAVLAEVHLLDYDGDLYGAELAVTLDARLRDERRFASVQALIEQMRADETEARRRLAAPPVSA